MSEKMLNTRIQQKHDIEVNWSKAVNFIPKIGEVIVYDPDENHAAARVKIGDGVKTVVELAFIDDAAKAALFKEIDMVDEKVEALGQLVGDASIPEQIEEALLKTQADWEVNDETSAAYIKNKPIAITSDRIDEICGIEPVMTLVVDEDGDAVINAGFPDDEGNLTI